MKIMFFEDDFNEDINVAFRLMLRKEIQGARIEYASNVKKFEELLSDAGYDVFILDIMTAETAVRSHDSGERVSRSRVGLELLKRLRKGHYGDQNKKAFIVVRSARTIDDEFADLCRQSGADECFGPGDHDIEIVQILFEKSKELGGIDARP
jgi:CheY-like chemotaxis protein